MPLLLPSNMEAACLNYLRHIKNLNHQQPILTATTG
jgi:hypothetical protein